MRVRRGNAAGTGQKAGQPAGTPAFRTEPGAAAPDHPSRRQTTALLSALVLVAAAIGTASYVVRPDTARSFDLIHGSLFLTDQTAPVGVDLASGRPTLRLVGADKQVGAVKPTDLALVPVHGGTLMVDQVSGQFNMVDDTGFVIKHDNGGVLLPRRTDATRATAVAATGGPETGVAGASYIVRTGPRGTNVLLVNESNVEEASRGVNVVRPRATLTTPAVAEGGSDAVAGANGDLWALFGTGNTHEVRQLSVAPDSGSTAPLANHLRATVTGPAAIATASSHDDGSGPAAVAVASSDRITYFPADGSAQRSVTMPEVPGLDDIVAAAGGTDRMAFLLHGSAGWSLVSLGADGSGLRGPTRISGIGAAASPARPFWSGGALYTIDRAAGAGGGIYRIDLDNTAHTVPGAARYPLAIKNHKVAEAADLTDAYVVARGSRVLINSPIHTLAVAVFTDGRRPPLVIRKSSAVDVSAAGGAEALTRTDLKPSDERGNARRGSKSKPVPGTQINNQVDCLNLTQKPHVPQLGVATPGSRSIGVSWTYPTLDPQDCIPSSYTVTAKALSPNAPSPGGSATVRGQTSANLTGLYPQTQYEITVTAYINGLGTTSKSIQVTTGREGPAAPTDVQARPDSSGNWIVTWAGCGSTADGCVAVQSWHIQPSICDGSGLSATPAALDVTDSGTRVQPPATYRGGAGLLGRGLSFRVVGFGPDGETGTYSSSTGCTYSWRAPDAGAVTVRASTQPGVTADGTTTVTATVSFADSQAVDLGGVGGTLTYELLSDGNVVSSVGPTQDASVQLSNVHAGQTYQVKVLASPPRHPEVVVPVGSVVNADPAIADWPTLQVTASFSPDTATTGTLSVTFDLAGTAARRETYDLLDSSVLLCGSTTHKLATTNRGIGDATTYSGLSRVELNGDCTVSVQLQQNADNLTTPPLFGAALSGVASTGVTIPPPSSTASASDFSATWGTDPDHPQVVVSYSGSDSEDQMSGWTLKVANGSTDDCGSSTTKPSVTIDVSPDCVKQGGSFSVSIDYSYYADRPHFDVAVAGTAPAPVDPDDISFTAQWGDDPADPTVVVTYGGTVPDDRLDNLAWTEEVHSSTSDQLCGSDNHIPSSTGPFSVAVDTTACPPEQSGGGNTTYSITISYHDPVYGDDHSYTPDITGTGPS